VRPPPHAAVATLVALLAVAIAVEMKLAARTAGTVEWQERVTLRTGPVEVRLQLPRDRMAQADRYTRAAANALERYAEWYGPYPAAHATIVEPAPWLSPPAALEVERVVHRAIAAAYWAAVAGRSANRHEWLVRSLADYSMHRALDRPVHVERVFGGFVPLVIRDVHLSAAAFVREDLTGRMTLALHTLEAYLGWPAMQRVLAAYYERFKFKNATPDDFFATMSAVSGRDLAWFVDQVYRRQADFDYGVDQFSSAAISDGGSPRHLTTVVVRRHGEAIFPGTSQPPAGPYESGRAIEVRVTFADGHQVTDRWDGRGRWKLFTYESLVAAVHAQVDPERTLWLDTRVTNNGRTLRPPSGTAATKWTLRWLIWAQDLLLTWSLVI